ncbi:hypothetical protein JL720_5794 [Aureococcus anophagefferens]|nr:hypothetical protein JL720_5794 [Aureococcus anophagefferens]
MRKASLRGGRLKQMGAMANLFTAFDEGDADGAGVLRWDQFSSYYCAVASASQSGQRSDLFGTAYKPRPYLGEDAFKRARIAKLHYVAKLEALLVVEVGSPAIGVFPAGEKGGLEPGPRQRWTPDGEGSVEEVLYVAPRRQLVVARSVGPSASTTSSGARRCRCAGSSSRRRASASSPRLFCYGEPTDCLFAFAPTTATLATWSMEERRLLSVVTPHRGGIVGAVALDRANLLVTAGQDKRLLVHDLGDLFEGGAGLPQVRHDINGGGGAIRALAYSDEYGLLVTAGYECEANCLDPLVSGRIGVQMRLVGHRHPLSAVAVVTLPSGSHKRGSRDAAVTLDTNGVFRLWDLDRAHCAHDHHGSVALCLHTFRVASAVDEVVRPRFLCGAWGRGRALVAATRHRAYFFEAVAFDDGAAEDDGGVKRANAEAPVALAYSAWMAQFYVDTGDEDKQTAEMNRRRRFRFVHGAHDGALVATALDADLGLLATASRAPAARCRRDGPRSARSAFGPFRAPWPGATAASGSPRASARGAATPPLLATLTPGATAIPPTSPLRSPRPNPLAPPTALVFLPPEDRGATAPGAAVEGLLVDGDDAGGARTWRVPLDALGLFSPKDAFTAGVDMRQELGWDDPGDSLRGAGPRSSGRSTTRARAARAATPRRRPERRPPRQRRVRDGVDLALSPKGAPSPKGGPGPGPRPLKSAPASTFDRRKTADKPRRSPTLRASAAKKTLAQKKSPKIFRKTHTERAPKHRAPTLKPAPETGRQAPTIEASAYERVHDDGVVSLQTMALPGRDRARRRVLSLCRDGTAAVLYDTLKRHALLDASAAEKPKVRTTCDAVEARLGEWTAAERRASGISLGSFEKGGAGRPDQHATLLLRNVVMRQREARRDDSSDGESGSDDSGTPRIPPPVDEMPSQRRLDLRTTASVNERKKQKTEELIETIVAGAGLGAKRAPQKQRPASARPAERPAEAFSNGVYERSSSVGGWDWPSTQSFAAGGNGTRGSATTESRRHFSLAADSLEESGHASPSGVDEVVPEGAILASLEKSVRLQSRFDALTRAEDDRAETREEKDRAHRRRRRLLGARGARRPAAKSWRDDSGKKVERDANLPTAAFYKTYGRFGNYDLATVLHARTVFKEFDPDGTGKVSAKLLKQITEDRSHFVRHMSSLKAILQGLVLMCEEARTSTCTFARFLCLVMCDANDAERARAESTAKILDLLVSLKATLAEEKPATMGALVKVLETEMSPVFKECKSGTVTQRPARALLETQRKSRRSPISGSADSRWSMVLDLRAKMRSSRRLSISLDSHPASEKGPKAEGSPPAVNFAVQALLGGRRSSAGGRPTTFASVLAGDVPLHHKFDA